LSNSTSMLRLLVHRRCRHKENCALAVPALLVLTCSARLWRGKGRKACPSQPRSPEI